MKNSILILLSLLIIVVHVGSGFAEEQQNMSRQEVDNLMRKAGKAYETEEFAEAIDFYRQAADWGNAWGQNNLAWILATFRQADLRDGKLALYYALEAVKQEPKNPAFVRTLAAAYARNDDFEKAIAAQEKMLRLIDNDTKLSDELREQIRTDHQEKLALYRQHEAYTDPK